MNNAFVLMEPAARAEGARSVVSRLAAGLARHAALFLALALVFLVYQPTFGDYFHGDDFFAFIDLVAKKPLPYMGDVFAFKDSNVYWRPLGQVYYLGMYHAFGLDATAFHVGNVIVFLVTLALVYAICLGLGLGRAVGVGAVLVFGLFPNHVLSVAWVTTVPRMIGVAFLLLALLLAQRSAVRPRLWLEAAALVAFVAACLSDETLAALAPLPPLLALALGGNRKGWWAWLAGRGVAFGAVAGVIVYLQFVVAPKATTIPSVAFGDHMLRNYWALTGKLVMPFPDGIELGDMTSAQWAAGAAAAVAAAGLLVAGSARVRLMVAWAVMGLAPFSLWTLPIVPARYVYLAAIPFAILVSWFAGSAANWVWRLGLGPRFPVGRWLLAAAAAPAAVVLVAALFVASQETMGRNAAFGAETAQYRILAEGLPRALPSVPPGATIVVYYGIWDQWAVWPTSVVKTVYRDASVGIINVPPSRVDSGWPDVRPKDRVVFFTGEEFIVPLLPPGTSAPPQQR